MRFRQRWAWAGALLLLASIAAAAAAPRLIHSENSLYREVFVYEDGNTRCLCFTRLCAIGRQTCIDLKQPDRLVFEYTQMMLGALYLKPDPHSILIIGLGGGTLPRTLEKLLPQTPTSMWSRSIRQSWVSPGSISAFGRRAGPSERTGRPGVRAAEPARQQAL